MKSNKELLKQVGETCGENVSCENCDMQVACRKDIYEQHEELKPKQK